MSAKVKAARKQEPLSRPDADQTVDHWFSRRGWEPFAYQREAWSASRSGGSGLIIAPTGVGKTYAALFGDVLAALESPAPDSRILWITPLKALASDTAESIRQPLDDLELGWSVELRTGDTSAYRRAQQRKSLPSVLVTTPESLSLLLSYPELAEQWPTVRTVIVDEWHELLSSKRGTQMELALARLRTANSSLKVWGISASIGNPDLALEVLLPNELSKNGHLVRAHVEKAYDIKTLLPESVERFPWTGHIGLKLLPSVLARLDAAQSTLVFTNTRSQCEIWYRAISEARPHWASEMAIHHGSLDQESRAEVEAGLKAGSLRCVVCTSTLDLGVDFSPVEQVIQVGSPKGVARMLQRLGRSGHQPGARSVLYGVPTHAFEIIEFAAARDALAENRLEERTPLEKPLDVLVQHILTVSLAAPIDERALFAEVQSTYAFRDLDEQEWEWALGFLTNGGKALTAYPDYARAVREGNAVRPASERIARLHRLSIGTITSDAEVSVRFVRGGTVGSIEESFIARLKKGNTFLFGGKVLELVQFRNLIAYVKRATNSRGAIPRWYGGRLPFSSQLATSFLTELETFRENRIHSVEIRAVEPLLELQQRWSHVPGRGDLLIESVSLKDGFFCCLFPMQGRFVHEGLGALLALRLTRMTPSTVSYSCNDYGIGLLSSADVPHQDSAWRQLLSPEGVLEDLMQALSTGELAKRQFREIARVAGLVFNGYPGQSKTARQLQVSAGLLFDVFHKYDPENLLLRQAESEVLQRQLELGRLAQGLREIVSLSLVIKRPQALTPFAFPLWAERMSTQLTSEKWSDRIERMVLSLEKQASVHEKRPAKKRG